jgi:3-deoxy-D-manno-octulosonic-acid transferase
MPLLLDALYLLALALLSPWLTWRAWRTGRYRRGLGEKLLGTRRAFPGWPVWFHGVSVGEVHLLRQVIAEFRRQHPDIPCVLSTTTDTGYDEACRCFPDLAVFYFPFDFSWAVGRTLRAVSPRLVVLAECELWPNFLLAARRAGVPVAVINARMSPRSLARYRKLRPLARPFFARLGLVAAQTQDYAAALRELGVPGERLHVTGSVKYDGACGKRDAPRTRPLRELFRVTPGDLVWVCGSTQAPEEEIALAIYRRARAEVPRLRLFLVPRQPDRFDEVARLLEKSGLPFVRRSRLAGPTDASLVLVDTLGELSALWGLADVAFVGGSLDGKRGGQNMIEPAGHGAAVVFGPHVWNFRDAAERLVATGAARQVRDGGELDGVIRRLLADGSERRDMGTAAREFVRRQQGATGRTVELLGTLLTGCREAGRAA